MLTTSKAVFMQLFGDTQMFLEYVSPDGLRTYLEGQTPTGCHIYCSVTGRPKDVLEEAPVVALKELQIIEGRAVNVYGQDPVISTFG